jgi:cytidylate kinase
VAQKLGYECISRDILIEASKEFNIPQIKLVRAIHDAPSILERFTGGKKKYLALFRLALLEHFQKDNVVYHGLAGHFFVKNVSHVLKVRIIAEMEDRVKLEMEREGISRAEALRILKSDDEERRKWSRHLFGIDTSDPSLYDIVIHIKKITSDEVVDLICDTVRLEKFQATPESQKAMDDLILTAKTEVAEMNLAADADGSTDN